LFIKNVSTLIIQIIIYIIQYQKLTPFSKDPN